MSILYVQLKVVTYFETTLGSYLLTFSEKHHMHALLCFALLSFEGITSQRVSMENQNQSLLKEWMTVALLWCWNLVLVQNWGWLNGYSILAILHNRKEKKPYHVMYIKKTGMGTNSQQVVQGKRTHVLSKRCVTQTLWHCHLHFKSM